MIITTQVTEDYYKKCSQLFESLKENFDESKVRIGCIGFVPEDCLFTTYYIPITPTLAYYGYKCANRPSFMTLQHGEFMDYIGYVEENEPILNIDADMILQTKFDSIKDIEEGTILVTYSCFPSPTLEEVSSRKVFQKKEGALSGFDLSKKEFCGAVLCALPNTFRDLSNKFKENFHEVLNFDHHAAGQLVLNAIGYKYFNIQVLPSYFHNADWFYGTSADKVEEGWFVDFKHDKKVVFIHTKFNGIWRHK